MTDEPGGKDKSRMIRFVPSFLGAAPRGEQKKEGRGWVSKGPAVCPRFNSFRMAVETASQLESAERLLRSGPTGGGPWKPM